MEQQLKQLNEIQNKITNIVELHRKNIDELYNWKQIKGYDNYSVSNRGEVRNDKTRRILKPGLNSDGYKNVVLCTNEKRTTLKVHRLVTLAFIENSQKKECVDHIDRNKLNNNISNLRWASKSENNQNKTFQKNNSSNVIGVSWHKGNKKWMAQININGKRKHLGYFDNLEQAKHIRNDAEIKYFGEFRKV